MIFNYNLIEEIKSPSNAEKIEKTAEKEKNKDFNRKSSLTKKRGKTVTLKKIQIEEQDYSFAFK